MFAGVATIPAAFDHAQQRLPPGEPISLGLDPQRRRDDMLHRTIPVPYRRQSPPASRQLAGALLNFCSRVN